MSDQVPHADPDGVPPGTPAAPPARASGFGRVLVAAAVSLVAVAGAALFIFTLVGEARCETLQRQYLLQVGHYAERMESVVDHYQQSLRALGSAPQLYCNPEGPDTSKGHERFLSVKSSQSDASCLVSLNELLRGPRQALAEQSRLALPGLSHVLLLDASGAVIESLRPTGPTRIGKIPLAGADSSQVLPLVEVGGEKHLVLVQPLHLDGALVDDVEAGGTQGKPLLLAGLVPEKRLELARLQVSPAYFLWAVLLLAFGILALPLGKLWLLGPKVPFRRFDVVLLLASTVLTALLSSVLFFGFLARNRLMRGLDERSERVAQELAHTMNARLDESLAVLAAARSAELQGEPCALAVNARHDAERCGKDALCRVQLKGQEDPRWNILFRTTRTGEQTQKWLRGDACTPFVKLSERSYFLRASRGELELTGPKGPDDLPPLRATAEVVRSVTSGSLVLLVASPRLNERGEFDGIDAVDTKLTFLRAPILPPGFQAAVVNRAGEIMLHSSNEAFHGQHLDESLTDPNSLRALLATRLGGPLRTEYLGEPTRAYALPLRGDWSVVVFARSSLADGLTRQIIAVSLIGFALLVFLEVILLLTACLVRTFRTGTTKELAPSPPRMRLLQPNADLLKSYATIGWLGITGGIALGFAGLFVGARAVTPLLLLALLGGVFARLELTARPRATHAVRTFAEHIPGPRRFCARNLPRAYSTAWLGMLSLLVFAPSAALFGGAYAILTDQAVRAEEEYAARAIDRRPGACDEDSQEVAVFGYCGSRAATPADASSHAAQGWLPSCLLNPFPCVLELLPPLKPTALPDAGRLYRRGVKPATESEATVGPAHPKRHALRPASLASSHYEWPALIGLCVVFAGFLLAAVLILHKSLDHLLFLSQLSGPSAKSLRELLATRKRLLVLATSELAQAASEQLKLEALPLHTASTPPVGSAGPGWYVCDLLTLSESELAQLERALATPLEPLVLFSASDWLRLSDPALRQRWALRLRGFGHIDPLACTLEWSDSQLVTMWSECDDDERRLLAQLALHAYVTPHPSNVTALRHLADRGVLDPRTLTIANLEIARFVHTNVSPQALSALESKAEGDSWHVVRVPLSTGVAVLLMCIGVSQPQLAAAGVAVPSLVALVIPLMRHLAGNKIR